MPNLERIRAVRESLYSVAVFIDGVRHGSVGVKPGVGRLHPLHEDVREVFYSFNEATGRKIHLPRDCSDAVANIADRVAYCAETVREAGPPVVEPVWNRKVADARRELEAAARANLVRLEDAHQDEQRTLERKLAITERALARHAVETPSEGLLSSTKKRVQWQRQHEALRRQFAREERAVRAQATEFALFEPVRRAQARAQACRERPEAAAILDRDKRIDEARALLERWRALERARAGGMDRYERLHVAREIRDITDQLGERGPLNGELSNIERGEVAVAHARSVREIARATERDRGRSW